MGVCAYEEGEPIILVFDCISFGKHEIKTCDGVKLKRALDILSKRINIPSSKIKTVLYQYTELNKNTLIKYLGLSSGAVLTVKFK